MQNSQTLKECDSIPFASFKPRLLSGGHQAHLTFKLNLVFEFKLSHVSLYT